MADVEARIRNIIQAQIEEDGYELFNIEMRSEGGASILRIFIDKPEGINIDDCAGTSRRIAVLLDVEDPVSDKYILEVSSPGIERPLFAEKDYIRFKGKEILLFTKNKIGTRRKFKGQIKTFENGVLDLLCDGQIVKINYEEIKKANLVYDFGDKNKN